jgi:hypothetical protein
MLVLNIGLLLGCSSAIRAPHEPAADDNRWSIGVIRTLHPLSPSALSLPNNPVFSRRDVVGLSASFTADPFLVQDGQRWHLFFEFFNTTSRKGEIGVAESTDLHHWRFLGPALIEPYHLSYPFVFQHQGTYYMIPETRQAHEVRLYRASSYPTTWTFERTLLRGDFADSSIAFFQGRWWIFTCESPYSMRIFYAPRLTGPWKPHRLNPIYANDRSHARPGGRPVVITKTLYRFVQNNIGGYGKRVRALVVDELTPSSFREHVVSPDPLLAPHGDGWARNGMHHFAPWPATDGTWAIAVDGSGEDREGE